MTIQTLVTDAGRLLADKTRVRWTTTDLVSFLNAAIAEICRLLPEQVQIRTTLTLVEGIYQTLPASASGLVSITRAMPTKRGIRRASFRSMDVLEAMWSAATPEAEIREYAYDSRSPRQFLVYPPAEAGAQVEAIYTYQPTALSVASETPASWPAFPLPDRFKAPALNYVLYRAFMVDKGGGSQAKAAGYYTEFGQSLGIGKQAMVAQSPDGEQT